jgi:hypothetical protein
LALQLRKSASRPTAGQEAGMFGPIHQLLDGLQAC